MPSQRSQAGYPKRASQPAGVMCSGRNPDRHQASEKAGSGARECGEHRFICTVPCVLRTGTRDMKG